MYRNNHLFIIRYYIHSLNYLKVKEIVTNNSISSLGCISSVKIQDNNVNIDLDLMIAGYPHRYILIYIFYFIYFHLNHFRIVK